MIQIIPPRMPIEPISLVVCSGLSLARALVTIIGTKRYKNVYINKLLNVPGLLKKSHEVLFISPDKLPENTHTFEVNGEKYNCPVGPVNGIIVSSNKKMSQELFKNVYVYSGKIIASSKRHFWSSLLFGLIMNICLLYLSWTYFGRKLFETA